MVDDPSELQRLQADHAVRLQETVNFQLGGPEKLTGTDDPWRALQKNGGLADLWYMDDGDILCHPIMVPSHLQEFDIANAKVGAERNPQTSPTWTTLCAAPGELVTCRTWPNSPQSLPEVSRSESLLDHDRTSRTNSWAKQTSFEQCTNACSSARTRRRDLPFERVEESVASTTFCKSKQPLKFMTRLGSGLLNGSCQVSRKTA